MPSGVAQPAEERFWLYVDKNGRDNETLPAYQHLTRCWSWTGNKCHGYGRFRIDDKLIFSHRFSYELYHPLTIDLNDIDLCILHKCDNTECSNPEHLRLGTHTENMRDRNEKGRGYIAKGEGNGNSKLTDTQVKEIRDKYAKGGATYKKLADEYKVDKTTIERIITRITWKHI